MSSYDIDTYKQLFEIVGFGVVDTSFLRTRIRDDYFESDDMGRTSIVEKAERFYKGLGDAIPGHITFPKKTIEEFDHHTDVVYRRWAGWHFNNDMTRTGEALQRLRATRTDLSRGVFQRQRTELYIPEEIKELYIPHIENALSYISKIPRIRMKVRENAGLRKHEGNDAHTLAMAVGVSENQDVCVLSGDSDLFRMSVELGKKLSYYARRFGFPIPNYDLDVLFDYRGGFKIVTHDNQHLDVSSAIYPDY